MKATHKTKKGFGGLLKAGLPCRIVKNRSGSVLICIAVKDHNVMYHGKIEDLIII